ncbi:hypothetical protein E4L98_26670 [Duganella callida]|uniref:XRE family transcriptional regulator n=1 Tax=Duganella callida TaxID=2561932 RepID=A0A4Y9S6S1_9BURK|nr:hypothetical protein E4L98_26670 [Duganella callida]
MLKKADLTYRLGQAISNLGLTLQQAADCIDMPAPWLSDLLLGKFRHISRGQIATSLARLQVSQT